MSLWILIALGVTLAAPILIWPLLRSRQSEQSRLDYDLEIYRAQLQELDVDVEAGAIAAELAATARREIERRILKAADHDAVMAPAKNPKRGHILSLLLVFVMMVGAIGLYLDMGSPQLPGATPQIEKTAGDANRAKMAQMIEKLSQRLAANPEDLQGWRLLARTYATLNQPAAAAQAFSKAIKLDPDDAALHANLGQMLVQSGGGTVSRAALMTFQKAAELDPAQVIPVYYLGLYDHQQSRPQAAYDRWLALYRRLPVTDPARQTLLNALLSTAKQLGIDIAAEPELQSPAPAIDKDAVAAAKDMSPAEQQEFIKSMVARLAARLLDEPDDLQGWMRLGRAYTVLEDWQNAANAYKNADRLNANDANILSLWARAITSQTPDEPVSVAAIKLYQQIETIAPDQGEALWYLGLASVEAGEFEKALERWRRLLVQIPEGTGQHQTLANAIKLLEQGKRPF